MSRWPTLRVGTGGWAFGHLRLAQGLARVRQRRGAIVARREVSAPAEAVIRFLADLEHHVRLAPESVQVLRLSREPGRPARALVRLTGPLGMQRTASTELVQTRLANSIAGQARIGERTVASVAWCVSENDGGSVVTLRATVDAAGPIDGMVLLLGGHRWLAKRFEAALERLSDLMNAAPSRSYEELTARAA